MKERYGGRKGAVTGPIKEALDQHIASSEVGDQPSRFMAYDGDRKVADAPTLDQLASELRSRNIDPRAVRVVSSAPVRQDVRAGLPGKRT